MIFRRNEPVPSKSVSNTNRPSQSQTVRRDPDLVGRPLPSQSSALGASPTQSMNPPVSPLNTAQARRKEQQSPVGNFTRQDQMRKLTVGRDISLNGEITTCDHLVVEGTVKATIKGGKMLEIAETGTFTGVVDIEQADIAGIFDGDLIVRGKLTIRPTANVTGTIHYGRLQVDTGAAINGSIAAIAVEEEKSYTDTDSTETILPDSAYGLSHFGDEPGFLKASA